MPRPVIIDTDAGVDDALALILAMRSPEISVKMITTVAGNVEVYKCTNNVHRILHLLNIKNPPPVIEGAKKPLRRSLVTAPEVHGKDGLGNTKLAGIKYDKKCRNKAVSAILRCCNEYKNRLIIIALGPLTLKISKGEIMKTNDFLKFMGKVRVFDLTQRLSIHTPPWPSYMPLGIQYFKRIAGAHMGQGANGQIITTSNHVGTHMDGEIHFHAIRPDDWRRANRRVDRAGRRRRHFKRCGGLRSLHAGDDHQAGRGEKGRYPDYQHGISPLRLGSGGLGRGPLFCETPRS